jgi:hypothetical protein
MQKRHSRQPILHMSHGLTTYSAVIVALVTVLMMQPAVEQIIHMIATRHSFVPAAWSMDITLFMADMVIQRMPSIRIGFAD